MSALTTILVGAGAVWVLTSGKKKRKAKKVDALPPPPPVMEPPVPPDEVPIIRWVAEEWWIPEHWFEDYATPRVQEIVRLPHQEGVPIDPVEVAHELLKDQTSGFSLPPSGRPPGDDDMWQVDVPNAPNYYNGPESVLGLLYHVAEYVDEGLGRWQAGDELYIAELDPYEGGA